MNCGASGQKLQIAGSKITQRLTRGEERAVNYSMYPYYSFVSLRKLLFQCSSTSLFFSPCCCICTKRGAVVIARGTGPDRPTLGTALQIILGSCSTKVLRSVN